VRAKNGDEIGATPDGDLRRARVVVSGRVQGVWFRGATADQAARLGVSGWVRNLADGDVEAAFEGSPARVLAAIEWCRVGPPSARVDGVSVDWEEPVGEVGFRVRY